MKNVVGEIFSGIVVQKDNNGFLVDLGIGIDTILLNEEVIGEINVNDEEEEMNRLQEVILSV